MAATYEPIASQTLGSAAASITFNSIAASWTDLRIVLVGTNSALYAGANLRFNSDSGTNYSTTILYGTGSSAGSYRVSNASQVDLFSSFGGNTTMPQMSTVDIFSYAGSTYKTFLWNNANNQTVTGGSGTISPSVGLWRSSSAITSISITASTGNWNTGTSVTLWGIKAA